MDFRFTPEQEQRRKEFEEFCKQIMKEAPPGWWTGEASMESDEGRAFHRKVARKMGEKGYLTLAWPKEYGGQELSPIEQLIFAEVRAYYGVPGWDVYGLGMVAPMLMEHGTEEQKKKHLLGMAKGEVFWCELWSEPNAGSDLASLTTQGVEDGDDYIINGQKRWTTDAPHADWGHMLVRTDPELRRSRGISFFLIDMKRDKATRDIPILMVTIVDDQHDKGMALGADDYCVKPIERKWLLNKLKMLDPVEKVLIIDDEEVARYTFKKLLAGTRYTVIEAADGEEGLRQAREEGPQAIFLDLIMPEMDGFEVLDQLKSDPATRDIPVIIYTGKDLDQEERSRLAETAVAILSKEAVSREEAITQIGNALVKAGLGGSQQEDPRHE